MKVMVEQSSGEGKVSLLSSFFVLLLSLLFVVPSTLDIVIQPLLYDGSIVAMGRYSMTQDALETIQEDEQISVVAMGSSMMFKAFNGSCFDTLDSHNDVRYYNLAIPSSRPYNDMLHIPRLIRANPDLVMLEVGVNLLVDPSPSSDEYLEFRYKMDTMEQSDLDVGGWHQLIEDRYGEWLATNQLEREQFKQEWFPDASEELLRRALLDESGVYPYSTYAQVPEVGTNEWVNFLQEPEWPPVRFDLMTPEVSQKYNETDMKLSAQYYKPQSGGTLSHSALRYMVEELTSADIKVVLTTLPHHPLTYQYLAPEQWNPLNDTLSPYVGMKDVEIIDNTWAQGWEHAHFDDRNHLDKDGREEFCRRSSPIISGLLGNNNGGESAILLDSDQDGFHDNIDDFPYDFYERNDLDGDGVGDNSDAFPADLMEQFDSDTDGVGDNADLWPNDPRYSLDSDLDGVPDQIDLCESPPILRDQKEFQNYQITAQGCYNVLPEEGIYLLSGGFCDSFVCSVDGIKPKLDYTILTIKYTSNSQMWVDYNDNSLSESWEINNDDMFAWFDFEIHLDLEWLEQNAPTYPNLTSQYSKQYMFNYIDNSTGSELAHLVQMASCVDLNLTDQLIGPIQLLSSIALLDLSGNLTDHDPFGIIEAPNQTWTKISTVSQASTQVCQ